MFAIATRMEWFVRFLFNKRHGPATYAVKTVAFAWVVGIGLELALARLTQSIDPAPPLRSSAEMIIAALIAAPLFENALMMFICEFLLLFSLRRPRLIAVLSVSIVFGAIHELAAPWHAIGAALVFGVMAFSYFHWDEWTRWQRYLLTVLQHGLFNLPATAIAAFDLANQVQ